jgi:hypothetical protein
VKCMEISLAIILFIIAVGFASLILRDELEEYLENHPELLERVYETEKRLFWSRIQEV